jgi:hypothetical protein
LHQALVALGDGEPALRLAVAVKVSVIVGEEACITNHDNMIKW